MKQEVLKCLYEKRKITASGHETTDTDSRIATSRGDYAYDDLAVEADLSYDVFGRLVSLIYHQGDTVLASYLWTYSDSSSPRPLAGEGQGVRAASPSSWTPNGGLPVIGSVGSGQGMLPVHGTSGVVEALLSGDYYSGAGRLASCSTLDGTTTYTYDAAGQLIGAEYSPRPLAGEGAGGEGILPDETYTYDANGNRLGATAGSSSSAYVIGPDNQLLSDGTYWYTYDADGNRTSRFLWTDTDADGQIDPSEESQITQYRWDNRNRLVQVTDRATLGGPATQIVTNYYDAENRWVGRAVDPDGDTGTAATHLTTFVYAGNQIVLQFDGTAATAPDPLGVGEAEGGENQEKLTAQNFSHRYLWADAVDQLLADEQLEATASGYDLSSPGNVVLPLTDQLGTVRDLAVCENGVTSVANHRVYDSYGNLKSETNAAVDCVFGFTGRPWDEATGLQDNGNRKYDPRVARWASEDPLGFEGGDGNTSRYVSNAPINGLDPNGLWKIDRNGGKTAIATAEANDSINTLAAQICLQPDEYRNWVRASSVNGLVDTEFGGFPIECLDPSFKVTPGETVTVPNTVLFWWAGEWGILGRIWVEWDRDKNYLRDVLGFNVEEVAGEGGPNDFKATMAGLSQSAELFGLFVMSHGSEDSKTFGRYEDSTWVAYADLAKSLSYHLGFAFINACNSAPGGRQLVSTKGIFRGCWKLCNGGAPNWVANYVTLRRKGEYEFSRAKYGVNGNAPAGWSNIIHTWQVIRPGMFGTKTSADKERTLPPDCGWQLSVPY